MGIFNIDLNNVNLNNDFDDDDPGNVIHIRRLDWHIQSGKRRALEKKLDEELMPVVWY